MNEDSPHQSLFLDLTYMDKATHLDRTFSSSSFELRYIAQRKVQQETSFYGH